MACAKLGTRVTSIVGAVLVSGGFLMSIFANNVVFLYISMGVIVGKWKNKALLLNQMFFVTIMQLLLI